MAANIKEAEKRIARGSARSSYKYLLIGQCRTLSSIDVKGHGSQTCSGESAFFFITSAEWMGVTSLYGCA
jgi:hypothetical protein